MKGIKVLIVLCGTALLITGGTLPLGEDYLISKDGSDVLYITNYNLQSYVPIPRSGDPPVTLVNRGYLEASVVWKDSTGTEIALTFDSFLAGTVYQAEISLLTKPG
jgi:hypothetical protein